MKNFFLSVARFLGKVTGVTSGYKQGRNSPDSPDYDINDNFSDFDFND